MEINPNIFRQYDIRGLVNKELTGEFSELLGKAVGTYLINSGGKTAVIGHDNRPSSPSFAKNLIKGLVSTGIEVIDLGLVPTPAYYFSIIFFEAHGGTMITGSHNPSEFNGFKISKGNHAIFGEEIQKIRKLMEKKDFIKGKGSVIKKEILAEYAKTIEKKIVLKKKLKVVLDCGNGVGSVIAPQILKNLGVDLTELYCVSDGTFPNHHPDPTLPSTLNDLIAKVKELNADIGIALDGDADRIGVVTDKGDILWGDQLMILFSRELLEKMPGAKILVEVKCSQALIDDIKNHKGIPILSPTGHSIIEAKMAEEHAFIAGEMSGHMFFRDEYFGFDDAIYASARILRILSNSKKKMSELLSDAPKYFSSPEIRVECSDDEKFDVVKKVGDFFRETHKVISVDGARVLFENGWGLVRASNTQPVLVLRFEAKTKEELEEIKSKFRQKLNEFDCVKIDF
ncbi:MAG: phosphomannomutase [Candidatus Diapherotrites archaeon CG10_big_fil_rev_8_21_14_0_10_31_34]|nr:MAG: phosphomannomutase [Candidatus Diapherotrites archaeon CG10_big_fil_rev_8_21_14_0_10_31_34]